MTAEQMLEKYKLTPEDMANYAIWGYVCDAMDAFASHEVAEMTKQRDDLLNALKELVHLHGCEQEGLLSGQPTSEQWYKAVKKAELAITKAEER